MAQYKVLKEFKDVYTKDLYKVDSTIDITKERADEIEANLSRLGGGFIEPVKTKLTIDDLKAELDELGVDYKDAKVKADYEKLLEVAKQG
ncbi:hypothetical protein [Enterococcus dongliensis]|uniref:hypothetical protein n=1 Tax=Enterococcus dongliensis TaxID=2559925 RepID=UPI0028922899|nr:hypothetical protein [Enterococcus dongliensis]MDT2669147.1 hypothetical protein [Enterococcus dongliensis]